MFYKFQGNTVAQTSSSGTSSRVRNQLFSGETNPSGRDDIPKILQCVGNENPFLALKSLLPYLST